MYLVLDSDTIFVILLLYIIALDFKSNKVDVVEVQTINFNSEV